MQLDTNLADDTLLSLIGERLANRRLAQNLTQQQLADQAGLGVRTIQRLESGAAATQLSGLIRVCRVLGLIEGLELWLPEAAVSPIAQLKLQGRQRQRASRNKVAGGKQKWQWGDPE